MKQPNERGGMSINGSYIIRKFKAGTKELLWKSPVIHNLVVSADGYGRNLIMRQLCGDATYGIEINNGKIGTGSTPPTNADTDLQAPILSTINVSNTSVLDNMAILSFFIADSNLSNGTYNEFGMFIGTRLFARSIITPAYTKGSGEDTTVDYTLTLT